MSRPDERQEAAGRVRAAEGYRRLRVLQLRAAAIGDPFGLGWPIAAGWAREVSEAIAGARLGTPGAAESILAFLEADPWCFRSGYYKQKALRSIRNANLSPDQRRRLGDIIVNSITAGMRLEFREVIRAARWLDSADVLARAHLLSMDKDVDDGVRLRAEWACQALERKGTRRDDRR